VHERLRLHQQDFVWVLVQLGYLRLEPLLKTAGARTLRQGVEHGKTDVVPGAGITAAGIAQANNNTLHGLWSSGRTDCQSVPRSAPAGYSASASSAAFLPITSGSALAASVGAAASGSASAAFTCTTTASSSAIDLTPGGKTRSRTWMTPPSCNSLTFT